MNNKIINNIKNISISKIISEYISINKKGRNYFAICPFHNDTNPSLVINDDKNIFKCFTCNTSGDAIKFVSQFNNISYSKAIIEIAKKFNIELDDYQINQNEDKYQINYDLNQSYLDLCQVYLQQPKFRIAREYLQSRNIDENDIKKFKIGFNPSNSESNIYNILTNEKMSSISNNKFYKRETLLENGLINLTNNGEHIDFFQNRIIFAISNQYDQIVGFSGRTINNDSPKYLNSPQNLIFNKSEILYNFNNFLKSSSQWSIYIVEGFMDVIALDKSGINNVVATMGVAITDQHIQLLKSNKHIESVILGFDNDNAGKDACIKNGLIISKYFNTFVVNQDQNDPKDFDEYLNKYGKEKLISKVNDIVHFSIYYLKQLIQEIKNEADFEHQYKNILHFLKNAGTNKYINEYINIFQLLNININLENIKNDLNHIYNNKYSKLYFSERTSPKSTKIKSKDPKSFNNSYKYIINRLIIACLIDHKIPNIILNNYYIQMDNILYNVINILIEFYSQNPSITSINLDTIKIFKEFANINKYNISIIDLIEEKMYDSYQYIKKYNFDENTLMKQILQSQIIKIQSFIYNENIKNSQLPFDSIERSESYKQIYKYIKLKNELIKNMKKYK